MKKFTVIILLALCVFTACSTEPQAEYHPQVQDYQPDIIYEQAGEEQSEPYLLYRRMTASVIEPVIESIDFDDFFSAVVTSGGEIISSMIVNANIKLIFGGEYIDSVISSGTATAGIIGDENIYAKAYHTGGMMYSEFDGHRSRVEAPSVVQDNMMRRVIANVPDFDESAINYYNISSQDGGTRLEIIFDSETAKIAGSQNTAEYIRSTLTAYMPGAEDIIIRTLDVTGEFLTGADDILSFYRIISDAGMIVDGEPVNMVLEMSTAVNAVNSVVIDFPDDLDEWNDAATIMVWEDN
jgi:hypothetical protein